MGELSSGIDGLSLTNNLFTGVKYYLSGNVKDKVRVIMYCDCLCCSSKTVCCLCDSVFGLLNFFKRSIRDLCAVFY